MAWKFDHARELGRPLWGAFYHPLGGGGLAPRLGWSRRLSPALAAGLEPGAGPRGPAGGGHAPRRSVWSVAGRAAVEGRGSGHGPRPSAQRPYPPPWRRRRARAPGPQGAARSWRRPCADPGAGPLRQGYRACDPDPARACRQRPGVRSQARAGGDHHTAAGGFGPVFIFNPTAAHSARFNPLLELRQGPP